MNKANTQKIVDIFNKRTGFDLDYTFVCQAFQFIDESKIITQEDRIKKAKHYSNSYDKIYQVLLSNIASKIEKGEKIKNNGENFLQEFNGMMDAIYKTEFEKSFQFEENDIDIDYGTFVEIGVLNNGLEIRNKQFKEKINGALELKAQLKKENNFNNEHIFSKLKETTNEFNPRAFVRGNLLMDDRSKSNKTVEDLGNILKVAREQYAKKGFFSRLFSFSERKAINQAKEKLLDVLNPDGRKLTNEEKDKKLNQAVGRAVKHELLVQSTEKPKDGVNRADVTDYSKIIDEINKINVKSNKDKDLEIFVNNNRKSYKEFLKNHPNLEKVSSEDRHMEFYKYVNDVKNYDDINKESKKYNAKITTEKLDINEKDLGENNINTTSVTEVQTNNLETNKQLENDGIKLS